MNANVQKGVREYYLISRLNRDYDGMVEEQKKHYDDILAEQEYRRTLGIDTQEIKTKPQKINYLLSKRNWKKSDLREKTPEQLFKIIQKV